MVNYSHTFDIPRPYYPTHTIDGYIVLAPHGTPHLGPLPDLRSLDLPVNFATRQAPLNMRDRNPGLCINTQAVEKQYKDSHAEDTTSYPEPY